MLLKEVTDMYSENHTTYIHARWVPCHHGMVRPPDMEGSCEYIMTLRLKAGIVEPEMSIARQRLGKRVSETTGTQATIE
jgi:hypothetical protein